MTNPTVVNRASRVAALLALAALLLGTTPARAASSIDLEARALVGGQYEVGGWLAVAVTLVNDGEPTDGYLTTETRAGTVRRQVEMPAGARKVVTLYVQPEAFQRALTVEYREPTGSVRADVEIEVMRSGDQVAVVGDGSGNLRPQLLGDDIEAAEPIILSPFDIPERPEPLAGLGTIVWAGDSGALSEAQGRSLERWIGEGGQLVVVGGADWQARTAAFTDLLPVEDLAAVDDVPQAPLAAWAGSDAPATETATVSTGPLRDGATALVAADDGTVLASMRTVGAGRVVLIGPDLATDAHRGWEGAPRLWGRLLPSSGWLTEWRGGGVPVQEEIDNALTQALGTLPSLEVPPAELLLAVIVGYILLIGPLSYVVLRRLDRRELAWVTAPVLIVIFSASSFGIGRAMKGSDVIINQISLVRATPGGTSATVESYAGVYSPDRASYDVVVETDALLGRLANPNGGFGTGPTAGVVAEQGDPAYLRGLEIGVFGFETVRAVGVVEHEPALAVTWESHDGEHVGTVTNNGEVTLEDVAWISSGGGEMIGDLEPGGRAEFVIPSTNFNGSTASDQVYGFGGFDSGSDEQRRILVRRQVIDALVGFGGFTPTGPALGSLAGRGPYLIGWRAGTSPMAVGFAGGEAQRYDTVAEVIASQPTLGSGEIVVRPHEMTIDIVETTGDASQVGAGSVTLGDGSVTYSLALPLEAAAMVVSEIDIHVGTDPSMVINDPGSVGGFWPDGYTLEVRDPVTGEWRALDDLSNATSFAIDDPSTAIGSAGRIEVRIIGEADPNFGPINVFVSASVRGVIDR
jgi:hypothetical protein